MEKGELKCLGFVPLSAQRLFISSVFVKQLQSCFTFPKSNLNLIQCTLVKSRFHFKKMCLIYSFTQNAASVVAGFFLTN